MPVQIDHMETAIEIARPEGRERAAAPRTAPNTAATSQPSSADRTALADAVGQVLAAELDRFLKTRGM